MASIARRDTFFANIMSLRDFNWGAALPSEAAGHCACAAGQ